MIKKGVEMFLKNIEIDRYFQRYFEQLLRVVSATLWNDAKTWIADKYIDLQIRMDSQIKVFLSTAQHAEHL